MLRHIKVVEKDILQCVVVTGNVVEDFLRSHCRRRLSQENALLDIVEHCLSDIGLLFRAFLLRASYEAGKQAFETVLPIAAGIELIQISTLVIDDVLDRSPMRNGCPSVYKQWGAELAISSGTLIGCLGLSLISNTLKVNRDLRNGLSVIRCLTDAHAEIYTGQFRDIEFEADIKVSEEKYFETIRKTTASFIGAPLVIGAMLWNAPKDVISTLEEVGLKLGMAYQLRDDVIDIIGDPECTGKPKAIDIQDRKMRLPVIHAITHLKSKNRERLLKLFEARVNLTESEVEEIINLLECAGSIEYTVNKTKEYCSEAYAMTKMLGQRTEVLTEQLRAVSGLISSFGNGWD